LTARQCHWLNASSCHYRANDNLGRVTMWRWLIPCAVAASLAGCTQPTAESTLGTNVPLASAPNLAGAATPGLQVWRAPDIAQYRPTGFYIPPATVDTGTESQFSGVDASQVAAMLTEDVRRAVSRRYPVANTPGPGIHTLQLVLVRVVVPHQMYISNGPYPWANAIVGMPNLATAGGGEMTVAGKFTVSSTGKLLAAFVAPVNPNDMMMGMPSGPSGAMAFARDASQTFATNLVASIVRQQEINAQTSQQ
jgi:uncharacterized protein DUF3313